MAKKKEAIIDELAKVKFVGPSLAEAFYDQLGVRNLEDLIAQAKKGGLQAISGVGEKKEQSILRSATRHQNMVKDQPPETAKSSTEQPKKVTPKSPEDTTKPKSSAAQTTASTEASTSSKPDASSKPNAAQPTKPQTPKPQTPKPQPRTTPSVSTSTTAQTGGGVIGTIIRVIERVVGSRKRR